MKIAAKTDPVAEEISTPEPIYGPWYKRQANWPESTAISKPRILWGLKVSDPILHPLSTDGERVFVVAAGQTYSISAEGQLLWTSPINADGPASYGPLGVHVPTALGVMQVLDPETGRIRGSHGGEVEIKTSLLILDGEIAWMDEQGALITAGGMTTTKVRGPIADAASDGHRIVVGSLGGQVFSVTNGTVHWAQPLPGPAVFHPVILADRVYVPFGSSVDGPGGVAAYDMTRGALVWVTHLKDEPGAAPSIGQHLIVPDKTTELVALDLEHGGIRWRAPGPAPFSIQAAVVHDSIYAGDEGGRLRRVDMADGGTVWSLDLGAPISAEPVIIGGTVIIGTSDGRIIAVGDE